MEKAMLFAEAEIWTAFFANLPATLIALGSLIGIILAHFKISGVENNVKIIEKATNSMKDALVQATHDAAFLQGKADERTNPEPLPTESVASPAAVIRKDIAAIPEKTATKVVEKLKEPPPPQPMH